MISGASAQRRARTDTIRGRTPDFIKLPPRARLSPGRFLDALWGISPPGTRPRGTRDLQGIHSWFPRGDIKFLLQSLEKALLLPIP
jgi:hypothetical protein